MGIWIICNTGSILLQIFHRFKPVPLENTHMENTLRLVVVGAWCLCAPVAFSQPLSTPLPDRLLAPRVNLSASASVLVVPDVLTLSLTTQRDGTEPQVVQSQLKTALDAALTQAKRDAKGELIDISTGRFGLTPRYASGGKITGWQGSAELLLKGRDFVRMGEMAGKLPTLTVAHASFSLTPEQRQGAEAQAQSQAIALFRQRASEAAQSFGYSAYGLIEAHINAGEGGGPRPPMLAMSARAQVTDAPLPLEAGATSVTVTVSGSVQLNQPRGL